MVALYVRTTKGPAQQADRERCARLSDRGCVQRGAGAGMEQNIEISACDGRGGSLSWPLLYVWKCWLFFIEADHSARKGLDKQWAGIKS